ncbi:MAG: flippase-like domain-containing protein [Caldilineaceae bacterium]|nr:flippase-like domain-containing protein [Caldilineaceae bacterium]
MEIARRPAKTLRYVVTLALLGLAVHLLLPQLASLEHALDVLRGMSRSLVLLAIGAQIMSYVGSGYLLQSGVSLLKQRITIYQGILVTLAANSMGLLAGGTVTALAATFRWLHLLGVNNQAAALAGVMPLLFNNGLLLFLSCFGLVYLFAVHQLSAIELVGFVVIALVILSFLVGVSWGAQHRTRLISLAHYCGRRWALLWRRTYRADAVEEVIDQYYLVWQQLRTGAWYRPAVGALLNNGFDLLTLYILFIAAGYPLKPGLLIVGYGLPLLFGKIGLLPGGVGVIEGTMAVLFGGFGVPSAVLVIVVLSYRLCSFWLPTILGFTLIPFLQQLDSSTAHAQ